MTWKSELFAIFCLTDRFRKDWTLQHLGTVLDEVVDMCSMSDNDSSSCNKPYYKRYKSNA